MGAHDARFLLVDDRFVEIADVDPGETFEAAVLVDLQCPADKTALVDDLLVHQFLLRTDDIVSRIELVGRGTNLAFERCFGLLQSAYLRVEFGHAGAEFGHREVKILKRSAHHRDLLVLGFNVGIEAGDQFLHAADLYVGLGQLIGRTAQAGDRLAVLEQEPVDGFDIFIDLGGGLLDRKSVV